MKLYENVVIGNFLYGLGVSVGARLGGEVLPASVNLLQQTPEDKALGDVLLSFPGTLRLIEFKSAANRSDKEETRFRKLSHALECRKGLSEVSHRIHWYVETTPDVQSGVKTYFSSYLSALSQPARQAEPLNLERFIAQTTRSIFSAQTEAEDPVAVSNSLKLIRWCQDVDEKSSAGALIVVCDGRGNLQYAELKNIMELSMTHEKWLEYRLSMEHGKELEREKSMDYDRGMDLSL
ncbi:hypothetical protein [Pantoea sp. SS70]|uniref:hypothetical protein n=1 Tax=Pantoea sp. SS70 TaxID=3024247 RepID=UPI002452DF25|nr:hypothetical protein [Pantoea sp. SS70]WGK59955.1 hypothetical protein PO881_23585 [Pantoea sp. SS70]